MVSDSVFEKIHPFIFSIQRFLDETIWFKKCRYKNYVVHIKHGYTRNDISFLFVCMMILFVACIFAISSITSPEMTSNIQSSLPYPVPLTGSDFF